MHDQPYEEKVKIADKTLRESLNLETLAKAKQIYFVIRLVNLALWLVTMNNGRFFLLIQIIQKLFGTIKEGKISKKFACLILRRLSKIAKSRTHSSQRWDVGDRWRIINHKLE